jgi:uncharacterized protein
MTDYALTTPAGGLSAALARLGTTLRTEQGLVTTALALVALHVVDDNFLQPARGTSPIDHLASGLIPLAVLAAVVALYPRLRPGARAATAMTVGAIGIGIGVPGAYFLLDGHASGDHYTGLLALAAGAALFLSGPVTLWRSRRHGGSRRRRYLARGGTVAVTAVAAPLLFALVVFPIAFAYVYTHTGRVSEPPALGMPYEHVTITTEDGLELTGSYVPSKNRAAVVVYPGLAAVKEAAMLARNGYGVLLLDPRGQGGSEGDTVRWAGHLDLVAGAEYLQQRPDVDPRRVAGFGSSVGGESLLRAAAASTAFAAVVSEGAGGDVGEDETTGAARILSVPTTAMLSAAVTVFSNRGAPPDVVDEVGKIAPRPVFLVYADPGMGGEATRQPLYYAAAGESARMWKVPDAGHTGGIDAHPAEFERRVVGFLDQALLDG